MTLGKHALSRLLLLVLLGFLAVASTNLAANPLNKESGNRFTSWLSNSSSQPEFLPPEQAFKAQAWVEGSQVFVLWDIEPGYYLYKDRFQLEVAKDSGLTLERIDFPPSLSHEDEYFGVTQVYYNQVELAGLLTGETQNKQLGITLHYQGCADAGLCYPPQQQNLQVNLAKLDTSATPRAQTTNSQINSSSSTTPAPPTSTSSQLTNLLSSGEVWLTLGLFFIAGLGLTFTPCVLPMLPILSTIIIGKGTSNEKQPKTRGLLLSSAYVLGMALTYAAIGALMGLFGASVNLQAAMQSPWLIIPTAVLFALLALTLFGAWELRLPAWLDNRLQSLQQPKGGTLFNVALMGALSTLIVSPCLTAPLAGALAFIATTGDAGLGSLALFMLGLGMGVPLILTGTFGAHWLPKAGGWMDQVKAVFGLLMLLMAAWLVDRLLPASISMLMWAGLALGTGVFIGGLNFATAKNGIQKLRLTLGLVLIIYGTSLLIGALAGNSNPLQPLKGLAKAESRVQESVAVPLIKQLSEIETLIANSNEPIIIDLYADWCISCKVMEAQVFPREDIQQALTGVSRYKFDLTEVAPETKGWLEKNQLFGPPTLMFFNQGEEWRDWRIQGEVNAKELLQHLTAFNQALN
ncbi:protein-disulfide reductase DsbD [Marinospirillum insulare]|uniref:Thiol:disulfide interchange protein DsbD n=1 Tax=Marinospirillum insulare TaxID=217169 RepID=A0ABQ6A1F8_9GAMM|nr:protein-disulfide reductase DsbD [Marinospirillum insulare]GLR64756.1 thiol:disulfide interchange protein DsbD [Marinospirillum insulare]